MAALPGVVRVEVSGQHLEILTVRPEDVLRTLLALDPHLRDLHVAGAGLEDAFLSLVRGDPQEEVA